VLTEIGGTVPGRALYVIDRQYDDPAAYADWLSATRPVVAAFLAGTIETP
jgi:FMN reductase